MQEYLLACFLRTSIWFVTTESLQEALLEKVHISYFNAVFKHAFLRFFLAKHRSDYKRVLKYRSFFLTFPPFWIHSWFW